MKYIDVIWHHEIKSEPVRLISEIDNQSNEVRKIEFFRDGRIEFASKSESTSNTVLSYHPFPSISDINSDSQFEAKEISQQDFEQYWKENALKI